MPVSSAWHDRAMSHALDRVEVRFTFRTPETVSSVLGQVLAALDTIPNAGRLLEHVEVDRIGEGLPIATGRLTFEPGRRVEPALGDDEG